jgi:hypothetical protein
MDRISAIRNVEEAIGEFEAGETDLTGLEDRVVAVVRTYATEFEDEQLAAYRAVGVDRSVTLVADSPGTARDRAEDRHDLSVVKVTRVDDPDAS